MNLSAHFLFIHETVYEMKIILKISVIPLDLDGRYCIVKLQTN